MNAPIEEMYRRMERTERTAVLAVVSNPDLIAHVLTGNIGPSTLVAASEVCSTWLEVCRSDGELLRRTALYAGGVTKGTLMGLFAISSQDANALPRTTRPRYPNGFYYLYTEDAIAALVLRGGWRARMRGRASVPRRRHWGLYASTGGRQPRRKLASWQIEERLHAIRA